jgi:K+-sensing histidine kinase KdpD
MNLLQNAFDAVVGTPGQHPEVWVSITNVHGLARLTVSDNSPGIPPEHLLRIFDPSSPPSLWAKAPAWARRSAMGWWSNTAAA